MKLRFLTGVCIGPGQDAEAGQIHEISDDNAKYFLNRGLAVKAEEIQEVKELSDYQDDHDDNAEEPEGLEEETPEHEEIQEATGKGKTETKKGTKK